LRTIVFSFLLSLLLSNFAYAKSVVSPQAGCLDCFNFSAPTILGAENVNPAEVGLIVYDSYFNKFRGYNSSGIWSKLSSESVVRTVSAAATLYSTDDVVLVNAASGAIALTLPSAVVVPGKELVIKKSDSSTNQVTIAGYSAETIDGSANRKLNVRYESVRIVSDGTNWLDVSQKSNRTPTIQKFISGSSTYATPAGVTYIRVRMVGGGGGGASSGTSSQVAGGSGGATTFGSSLLIANGGGGGAVSAGGFTGGAGGGASVGSGPIGTAVSGGGGSGGATATSSTYTSGGAGGASALGGGGSSVVNGTPSLSASANTGGGGGGGGCNTIANCLSGAGGGSGGFIDVIIANPATSYAYSVGGGGGNGSAGTNGYPGANGGSGYIEVTEYYQ